MFDTGWLLLGVACAWGGGELFVRGVVGLSLALRVSAGIVGATVAAFATSSPELSVGVNAALAAVGRAVPDWEGGTRIGAALGEFNLRWSRRLLAQGALVLLVTDGLDREDARALAEEAARLRRSCRRLVWLNPLLRFEGFEPLAEGVRALLPHVDEFRPVHDLQSLADLARALSGGPPTRPSRRAGVAGTRPAPPTAS